MEVDIETEASFRLRQVERGTLKPKNLLGRIARREGVLLVPLLFGKVAAGMIGRARAGDLAAAKGVIFIHTGGQPAAVRL